MTTLTFSSTTGDNATTYAEAGFRITTDPQTSQDFDVDGQELNTHYSGEVLTLVKTDGTPFTLDSLQIDGAYNYGDSDEGELLSVTVTGFKKGAEAGHAVVHLDGTDGFQTFNFGGSGITDVDSLTITAPNFNFLHIDNVTLDATAPLTAAPHALADAYGTVARLSTAQLAAGAANAQGPLSLQAVGAAYHGTVTTDATGHAVYTPYVGYVGGDSFTYTLSDGAQSAQAIVAVTVAGPGGAATAPAYVYGGGLSPGQTFDVSGDGVGHSVLGTSGADVIYGGAQADNLNGGAGDDAIFGGAGADVITGGAGADTVTGGAGADTFVIAKADLASGPHLDEIMDFEGAGDGYHPGAGDILTLTGFGPGATLTLDAAATASASDPTAHYYKIAGAVGFTGEIIVHYVGSAVLAAGDYGFH